MFSINIGVVFGVLHFVSGQHVSVDLTIGTIHGKTTTVNKGNSVHNVVEYLGIPYAKAPVGDLRFAMPEPMTYLSTNPYNATYYRPFCPQMAFWLASQGLEDENCLYLNVFVPETPSDLPTGHAVMVWIHGGGFQIGSSNDYHGSYLAAVGNVIVVTINYRLGPLGFLSSGDDAASGNYGLYDQGMALQWIHDNINSFGGDNDRVTIFGESAGGMSVCYQGLYNGNYGRFQRIIAESGAALTKGIDTNKDPVPAAQALADNLGCETADHYRMIECLRSVPWVDVKSKIIELSNDPNYAEVLEFNPRADGNIIKGDLKQLSDMLDDYISEEVTFFRSIDFLSGFNAYEGGLFMSFLTGGVPVDDFQPTHESMMLMYADMMFYMNYGQSFSEDIKRTFQHEYTNWSNPMSYESVRVQLVKAISDISFVVPAIDNAMLHLGDDNWEKTFMYHFTPTTSVKPSVTPSWLPGADHMEEIPFVFGQKYETMSTREKDLSDRMIAYWTNFAKSGCVFSNFCNYIKA